VTRPLTAGTLLAVLIEAAAAALVYFMLFFGVAIGRRDRMAYVSKLKHLLGRRGRLAPAA